MNIDMNHAIDSVKDGTKEVAEIAHNKTSEFHENYVSHILPDCGKYGDAAKFLAEMAPGVAEYNAIREGDWQAFAISAGIDVASIAIGAVTAGAGAVALKGGTVAAKSGVKVAVREVAEAGAKKAAKEVAEAGVEKAAKEVAEAGVKKVAKEVAEAGAEKAAKEFVEAGAEKVAKEVAEAGVEKAAKEVAEAGAKKATKEIAGAGVEKAAKEVAEAGVEKAAKEVAGEGVEKVAKEVAEEGVEKAAREVTEEGVEKSAKEMAESGTEKAFKEVDEVSQALKNKLDGLAREGKVFEDLISKFGENNVLSEQFLRDKAGNIIKDSVTGEARRIDFIVKKGEKIIKSIEVTSKTAPKIQQIQKEMRILEKARELGGAFIKDPRTGQLIEFTKDIVTEIVRLD